MEAGGARFFLASIDRMDQANAIGQIIGPSLEGMGYELVRVQLRGGSRLTLQIMVERTDRTEMSLDDCAEVSRNLSAILDVEDPIGSPYILEVSSPGIDRPLVRLEDFERFKNLEARIESRVEIEGRKRFRGILTGVNERMVCIAVEGRDFHVPYDQIQRAKLVLTDQLLAASRSGSA